MISHFVENPILTQERDKVKSSDFANGEIKEYVGMKGGMLFFCVKNKSKSTQFLQKIKMKEVEHIALYPPFNNMNEINFIVPPRSTKTVLFRATQSGNGAYSYSYTHVNSLEDVMTE